MEAQLKSTEEDLQREQQSNAQMKSVFNLAVSARYRAAGFAAVAALALKRQVMGAVETQQAAAYEHEKRMRRNNRHPALLPPLVPIRLHVAAAPSPRERATHLTWDGVGSWSLRDARYHIFIVDKQLLEARPVPLCFRLLCSLPPPPSCPVAHPCAHPTFDRNANITQYQPQP